MSKLTATNKRIKWKEELSGWLFVLPVVIGILAFTAMPMFSSLYYSFTEYDTMISSSPQRFLGLQNYIDLFTIHWSETGSSLATTFIYTLISVPLTLVLSFSLALPLAKDVRGMRVFRTLIYAPVLIPTIVSGLLWLDITSSTGAFNIILSKLNLPTYAFFNSAETAMFSFIFMGLFTIGGSMILWIAQIKGIPETMFEAARIEGAGYFRQLFKIIIPMCTPMIFYNLIMALINCLQTYASAIVVINHFNSDALNFYVGYIYRTIVTSNNLGLGCAISWVLFVIIAVITGATFKLNKWVYYEEAA